MEKVTLLAAALLMTGCSLIVEGDCGDAENNFCPEGYRCDQGRCVPDEAGCESVTECDPVISDGCCPPTCNEFTDVDCCEEECCCPEPSRCVEGVCREPRAEECNDVDDDFDDAVDEDFDTDGDGVSSCPFVDAIPDCDDSNAAVYPGNEEVCDGLDNDCDGNADDGNLCPTGQRCNLMLGRCVDHLEPCDEAGCPEGFLCHTDGICYPAEVNFGDACVMSEQCTTGRCLTTSALGIPGRRCTDICCDENDCPSASFCAVSETGLRLCASRAWFDVLGVSCGAETCPACWQSDCHTTCCSDSDCAEGCQVANEVETPLGTITTTVCDARGTGGFSVGLYGESECGQIGSPFFTYCASGFQWVTEMTMGIATACVCSAPCCSHADCTDGGADPDARCVSTSTGHTQCYSALIFEPLMGGALGDHCSDWDDCASGACHPDGYCTEPCCSEMNCPTGSRCVPTLGSGGSYANLCTIP